MANARIPALDPVKLYDEYPDIQWIPAPCQKACPVGTDAPSYIGLIWEGKYEEALEVITATNPFSSVCGRVCAKPCETQCRRGESDAPVTIRNLKRFIMDQLGHDYRFPEVGVTQSKTVGIVGGGPAGLTAAHDLAHEGYEVHVYEARESLGGMMRVIPRFRLPESTIQDDLDRLLTHCPGIKVHLNRKLGKDITLEELKKRHDAVVLSIGLWTDRRLGVPGEAEKPAGLYGLDFLMDMSGGAKVGLSGTAAVIGGGNVAMDMARTALRAGAQKVELYCLETREEMPAWKHEIEEAEKEGIQIVPSWGVKQILSENGKVTGVELMRCQSVFDYDGRFNPTYDPSQTQTVKADAVLLAIGQMAQNEELENTGLLQRGLVRTDAETMITSDPKVFAAGDASSGPSAIVTAMGQGHRAAYYVHAFLEGRENPLPYSIPFRTRRIPLAQDPAWEKLPREEQPFLGVGSDPSAMTECETAYDADTAKRQALRCLRCDAETGHSDYSRRTREHIHIMARTEPGDAQILRQVTLERLKPRKNPFPETRPAHLDDVVFLSAALTRLVIDPYREACSTRTVLAGKLELKQPYLFTGFDDAADELKQALAAGLVNSGSAYVGFKPLPQAGPDGDKPMWLQLLTPDRQTPDPDADGLVYVLGKDFKKVELKRAKENQLLGLSVAAPALEQAIPYALDHKFDFLLLDGTAGIETAWPELKGAPDLTVMRDAIRILRRMNMEEEIALLYFGGLRSGTDVAKALAINCNAGIFSVAMAIAMGGAIADGSMKFTGDTSREDRARAVEHWIKGTAQETAIIARCTGKTFVHNLEPEDMRSITIATSQALDIPLAAGKEKREGF